MPESSCPICHGTGWHEEMRWSDHGHFKEEIRCQCNPAKWSTVLDFVLGFQRIRVGNANRAMDILDSLSVELTREQEEELKRLLS